jgi:hypothetical protein
MANDVGTDYTMVPVLSDPHAELLLNTPQTAELIRGNAVDLSFGYAYRFATHGFDTADQGALSTADSPLASYAYYVRQY